MKKVLVLFMAVLLVFGIGISAFATSETTSSNCEPAEINIPDNFPKNHVPALNHYFEIKQDPPDSATLYDEETGNPVVDVEVENGKYLSFDVKPGFAVYYVFVKGGTGGGGTLYYYENGCTVGDEDLIANLNQNNQVQNISHYTFYYLPVEDEECVFQSETAWGEGSNRIDSRPGRGQGNWAMFFKYGDEPTTVRLLAGQTIEVGNVSVSKDEVEGMLYVTFTTENGWKMAKTHLYVGGTEPTKSAPGQLGHSEWAHGDTVTYEISLDDFDSNGDIFIAAHAEVSICSNLLD